MRYMDVQSYMNTKQAEKGKEHSLLAKSKKCKEQINSEQLEKWTERKGKSEWVWPLPSLASAHIHKINKGEKNTDDLQKNRNEIAK